MTTWRAPGRISLIGEHTDYNEGFVLALAIDQGCTATVITSPTPRLHMTSAQVTEPVTVDLAQLRPAAVRGWAAYVAGVVWALRSTGRLGDPPGLAISVDSTVPTGAGLSSSAALVCSVAAAVNDLLSLSLSQRELVNAAYSAENDFVGAPTGGMDQLASMLSQPGHCLFCDMRTLQTTPVPLALDENGLALLVIDSRAKHQHATGEYRQRRADCEKAARLLGVAALRDIVVDSLDAALAQLPQDLLRRRVRHVVTENDRVLTTLALLREGTVREIGPLLTASHASMRDDYEITVAEVDHAVDTLLAAGAYGARMTGGGFGGCVIALIDTDAVDTAIAHVRRTYDTHGYSEPTAFLAHPAGGAHRMAP